MDKVWEAMFLKILNTSWWRRVNSEFCISPISCPESISRLQHREGERMQLDRTPAGTHRAWPKQELGAQVGSMALERGECAVIIAESRNKFFKLLVNFDHTRETIAWPQVKDQPSALEAVVLAQRTLRIITVCPTRQPENLTTDIKGP